MAGNPPASPTLERFSIVIMSIAGVGVETACKAPGSESMLAWGVFVGLVVGVFFAHAWLRQRARTASPPALTALVLVGLFFVPILLASGSPMGARLPQQIGQKCRQVLREWTFQRFHALAKKGTI